MSELITTLGTMQADDLEMILPHEHIFVGMETDRGPEQTDTDDVVDLMAPEIEKVKEVGVTALVVCTPVGVGRYIAAVKAVSEETDFPIAVPTGIYREPWIPDWAHAAEEAVIRDWMLSELQDEIEDTGVQAAWIKLSAGDEDMTETEAKILRAAGAAGLETHACIGSHTVAGRVVKDQLAVLEEVGYPLDRFIWIHAQNEEDFDINVELGKRGVWIEYDAIGSASYDDDFFIDRIRRMLDAGLGDRLLLSHDRGWYDPSKPGGGTPRPFTYISETFLPKLADAGIDQETVRKMTVENPFRAFAR
jgi:phosphotriesterase-related protein